MPAFEEFLPHRRILISEIPVPVVDELQRSATARGSNFTSAMLSDSSVQINCPAGIKLPVFLTCQSVNVVADGKGV